MVRIQLVGKGFLRGLVLSMGGWLATSAMGQLQPRGVENLSPENQSSMNRAPKEIEGLSVRELLRSGKVHLEEQDYELAFEYFSRASAAAPDLPEPKYDQGVAKYRLGAYAQAKEFFAEAIRYGSGELAAQAHYNMGNCDYAAALKNVELQPPLAKQQLSQAIQHYRDALRLGNDLDARTNIELAARLIKSMQDPPEQQSEQQPDASDPEKSDPSNKQDPSAESENSSGDSHADQGKDEKPEDLEPQNQSSDSDPKQGDNHSPESNQPTDAQESGNPADDEARDNKQDSASSQSQLQQENSQEPSQVDGQGESAEQTKDSPTQGSNSSNLSAEEEQSNGTEASTNHNSSSETSGEGIRDQSPSDQSAMDQTLANRARMTPMEAEKLLQAVRDRELRRRLEQLQRAARSRGRVERDW